ncbi:MAG: PQQ-binding-like beta-propeller repeat protein [Planctomycetota bacterium]
MNGRGERRPSRSPRGVDTRRAGLMSQPKVNQCLAILCIGYAGFACGVGSASAQGWSHLGGTPSRGAIAQTPGVPFGGLPVWTVSQTTGGLPIDFVELAGVVTNDTHAYAHGFVDGIDALVAVELTAGTVAWYEELAWQVFDSWSTPAVADGAVYAASGDELASLDAATGSHRFTTILIHDVVNSSPVVTTDLGAADRVFITGYDGSGFEGGGALYCINADPFDAALNPYQPGDIVWVAPLRASSGNTAAYHDGVVYVADTGLPFNGVPGRLYAFDAHADAAPTPEWTSDNPLPLGFFGGVSLRIDEQTGAATTVYAATYAFGTGDPANLLAVDASTGAVRWQAPCNRTSSTPLPLSGGLVAVSAGIDGFGSRPSLALYRDHGDSGELLWDTAIEAQQPGGITPRIGGLNIGHWTQFPVALRGPGGTPRLLVPAYDGTPADDFDGPTDLLILDPRVPPNEDAFYAGSLRGGGASPAAGRLIVTIGPGGLAAFETDPVLAADVDGDGRVNIEDLYEAYELEVSSPSSPARDVTRDGVIDGADLPALRWLLRRDEFRLMGERAEIAP